MKTKGKGIIETCSPYDRIQTPGASGPDVAAMLTVTGLTGADDIWLISLIYRPAAPAENRYHTST